MLTKAGEPIEVAHIFPFSMRYENGSLNVDRPRRSFWATLRMFWAQERVDAWHNAIFPLGTEVCQNLICLALHVHGYWERGYFALKPIRLSDDKKRLDVQFFWLQQHKFASQVNILQTPSLPKGLDQGPNFAKLWNHQTDKKICSGDEISLETDDPATRPLPDFKVLEMQWFLHRVTAMSGAAEPLDDFCDDGDNSDDDVAMELRNRWDSYAEDEWELDTDSMLDMDIDDSSSTAPIPDSSPLRPVPQHPIPQLPENHKFEHIAIIHGEEGPEVI